MSIPHFDPKMLADQLNQQLASSFQFIESTSTEDVSSIHEVLTGLGEEWISELNTRQLDFSELNLAEESSASKINELVTPYFIDADEGLVGVRVSETITREIHHAKLALQMEGLLESKGFSLECFLKDPSAKEIFIELAKMGDARVCELIYNIIKEEKKEFEPHICDIIIALSKEFPNDSNHFYLDLLKMDHSGWVGEMIVNILLELPDELPFLQEELITCASRLEPNAICALFQILSNLDFEHNPKHIQLMTLILDYASDEANPDESLQNILFATLSEIDSSTPLAAAIVEGSQRFNSLTPSLPVEVLLLTDRLIEFAESASLKKMPTAIFGIPRQAKWNEYSLKVRLSIKILHVQRDRRLINCTLGDPVAILSNPTSVVTSKYFPEAEGIIVGLDPYGEKKYYCERISKALKEKADVEVYTSVCEEATAAGLDENVRQIVGTEKTGMWVQDVCMASRRIGTDRTQLLFPRFTNSDELDFRGFQAKRACYVQEELYKMDPTQKFVEVPFSVRGRICSSGEQYMLLGNLIDNCETLYDLSQSICFYEGGNVLSGADPEPYVLCGQDLIHMNAALLKKDLKALGLYWDKRRERWAIQSTGLHQSKVKLSLEKVKYFIAADFGLSSPKRVYSMIQLDYHLDMAVSLVGPKTVAIQDSVKSWKLQFKSITEITSYFSQPEIQEFKKIKREARDMFKYEKIAIKQLQDQGFNTIRVAGRYKQLTPSKSDRCDVLNFFNFISLKLRRPSSDIFDKYVVVALSCEDDDRERFKEIFADAGVAISYIFLNNKKSRELLSKGGGINCLSKVLERKLPF